MEELFRFKHFAVRQDKCAMKVGTDGVLLGAWANGGSRILDIGAGTGLLSLMMAQRFPLSRVEGVEIDGQAALQASENVDASPFASRISIMHRPIQQFVPAQPYDCVVSNPPFYLNGPKAAGKARSLARCADSLPYGSLFSFASEWLVEEGELSVIVPLSTWKLLEAEAYLAGFRLFRKVELCTKPHKPLSRCLAAFRRSFKGSALVESHNLLESDGGRSAWYDSLVSEFYL